MRSLTVTSSTAYPCCSSTTATSSPATSSAQGSIPTRSLKHSDKEVNLTIGNLHQVILEPDGTIHIIPTAQPLTP